MCNFLSFQTAKCYLPKHVCLNNTIFYFFKKIFFSFGFIACFFISINGAANIWKLISVVLFFLKCLGEKRAIEYYTPVVDKIGKYFIHPGCIIHGRLLVFSYKFLFLNSYWEYWGFVFFSLQKKFFCFSKLFKKQNCWLFKCVATLKEEQKKRNFLLSDRDWFLCQVIYCNCKSYVKVDFSFPALGSFLFFFWMGKKNRT